jgi:hypothetical protein
MDPTAEEIDAVATVCTANGGGCGTVGVDRLKRSFAGCPGEDSSLSGNGKNGSAREAPRPLRIVLREGRTKRSVAGRP